VEKVNKDCKKLETMKKIKNTEVDEFHFAFFSARACLGNVSAVTQFEKLRPQKEERERERERKTESRRKKEQINISELETKTLSATKMRDSHVCNSPSRLYISELESYHQTKQ
jgi:hypothetical protein